MTNISFARILVENKINNQIIALHKTRKNDELTKSAVDSCKECLRKLTIVDQYDSIIVLWAGADSVVIFDIKNAKIKKYGNAIHRDQEVVYF